jgi:hypothetical protein
MLAQQHPLKESVFEATCLTHEEKDDQVIAALKRVFL